MWVSRQTEICKDRIKEGKRSPSPQAGGTRIGTSSREGVVADCVLSRDSRSWKGFVTVTQAPLTQQLGDSYVSIVRLSNVECEIKSSILL